MQYHSEWRAPRLPNRDRMPWNVAEQWDDPGVVDVYRAVAPLRMRLIPYITAEADQAAASGLPLTREMPLAFPDDAQAARYPYQYLLGERLLVAPAVRPGVASWDVSLPSGRWRDFWSQEGLRGPGVHTRSARPDPGVGADGDPGLTLETELGL